MIKKLLLLMLVVFTAISCEGPMGPPGRDGYDGKDGDDGLLSYWKGFDVTIFSEDWKLVNGKDQLGSYYEYTFSFPEIDSDIYHDGLVIVYLVENLGKSNETKTPLAQGMPQYDKDGNIWIEGLSFSYKPGNVTFYVDYSDFATGIRPNDYDFKVVILY